MFVDKYPNFTKGRILKAEMLVTLRDYAREWLDLHYQAYSDGVIAGCDVRVVGDLLMVSPGMIKHRNQLYRLAEDVTLPLKANGQETVLKVKCLPGTSDEDYTTFRADIELDTDTRLGSHELELGRFKLKEGAQLRTDYRSFQDLATEYNTLSIIYTDYSGREQPTLHPRITQYFAAEVLKSDSSDVHDLTFAYSCLNQGGAERNVLLHYLARRGGTAYQELSNAAIYKQLARILDRLRSGGKGYQAHKSQMPRRMIVD